MYLCKLQSVCVCAFSVQLQTVPLCAHHDQTPRFLSCHDPETAIRPVCATLCRVQQTASPPDIITVRLWCSCRYRRWGKRHWQCVWCFLWAHSGCFYLFLKLLIKSSVWHECQKKGSLGAGQKGKYYRIKSVEWLILISQNNKKTDCFRDINQLYCFTFLFQDKKTSIYSIFSPKSEVQASSPADVTFRAQCRRRNLLKKCGGATGGRSQS